jgi:hypothetical protein
VSSLHGGQIFWLIEHIGPRGGQEDIWCDIVALVYVGRSGGVSPSFFVLVPKLILAFVYGQLALLTCQGELQ